MKRLLVTPCVIIAVVIFCVIVTCDSVVLLGRKSSSLDTNLVDDSSTEDSYDEISSDGTAINIPLMEINASYVQNDNFSARYSLGE